MSAYQRSAYHPHERVTLDTGDESVAKQSFKEDCDINRIMEKYAATGLVDHAVKYQGRYEDVSSAPDLQEAIETCRRSGEMFDSLPSAVRRKFDNDPILFLEWVQDPANSAEVKEMGLAAPEEPPTPVIVSEPLTAAPEADMAPVEGAEAQLAT